MLYIENDSRCTLNLNNDLANFIRKRVLFSKPKTLKKDNISNVHKGNKICIHTYDMQNK